MGSLIVAGYDLLDPASPARVMPGTDLGSGVPDTQTVARLLLDGDVVTGARTGNRPVVLPIVVTGATYADRVTVFNNLARAVDQAQWSMPWTPDDGLPTVVFDCFRGRCVRDWTQRPDRTDVLLCTLQFEASPFTRDAAPVVVEPVDVPDLSMPAALVTVDDGGNQLVDAGGNLVARAQPGTGGDAYLAWFGGVFGSATDFRLYEQVSFYAQTQTSYQQGGLITDDWVFSTADQDAAGVPAPACGQVRVTLVDQAGRKGTWWASRPVLNNVDLFYGVTVTVRFGALERLDAGFDRSQVSSWWVRWYMGDVPAWWWQFSPLVISGVTATANLGLAGALAQAVFRGVQGVARSPVGVTVDAGADKASRVLLARSAGNEQMLLTVPSTDNTPSTDSTALSGNKRTLSNPVSYQVQAADYAGSYTVLARLRAASTGTFTVRVQVDGANSADRTVSFPGDYPSAAWQLVPVGAVPVPPTAVGRDSTATSTISLSVTSGTASLIELDMVVIVPTGGGDFLLIDSPTAYRYWWLTVPDASDRAGAMYAGDAADGTDAVSVSAFQSGQAVFHFEPGDNQLAILLDQAGSDAKATVTYYPRWFGERPE